MDPGRIFQQEFSSRPDSKRILSAWLIATRSLAVAALTASILGSGDGGKRKWRCPEISPGSGWTYLTGDF
jgi:hypothetical protein